MKKIITAALLTMTMVATIAMAQIDAKGEGEKRQSKTMSVDLGKIIMEPGDKKQIVLEKNGSVTFEFNLPKPGSCIVSIIYDGADEIELNMGAVSALIKKGRPSEFVITRDAKNPKPTKKFINWSGKKTAPITFKLSPISP